jgi:hypothetical protein
VPDKSAASVRDANWRSFVLPTETVVPLSNGTARGTAGAGSVNAPCPRYSGLNVKMDFIMFKIHRRQADGSNTLSPAKYLR